MDQLPLERAELIIHPVRLRILQALTGEALTTQEIAARLPDVATSSIYRHVKLLLEGEIISVVERRLVHGIQEKVYGVAAVPLVDQEALDEATTAEHFRFFVAYVMSLLQEFAGYLNRHQRTDGKVDLEGDYAGYREVSFYASPGDLDAFQQALQEAVQPLLSNRPAPGRTKHKLAIVSHPVPGQTGGNGGDQ